MHCIGAHEADKTIRTTVNPGVNAGPEIPRAPRNLAIRIPGQPVAPDFFADVRDRCIGACYASGNYGLRVFRRQAADARKTGLPVGEKA